MEVHASKNTVLLDVLVSSGELCECDRDAVFRLLFSGEQLRFDNQEELFTIRATEPGHYVLDFAEAYKDSCILHCRVREELYEQLDLSNHILQRVVFYHPVHGHAYLEYMIERELGKGSTYFFRSRSPDDAGVQKSLIEVSDWLAWKTIMFLMASGMIQSYDVQVERIE